MIKKGELYKEHIEQARIVKEQSMMEGCTFKPELNFDRNKISQSKVKELIETGGIRRSLKHQFTFKREGKLDLKEQKDQANNNSSMRSQISSTIWNEDLETF